MCVRFHFVVTLNFNYFQTVYIYIYIYIYIYTVNTKYIYMYINRLNPGTVSITRVCWIRPVQQQHTHTHTHTSYNLKCFIVLTSVSKPLLLYNTTFPRCLLHHACKSVWLGLVCCSPLRITRILYHILFSPLSSLRCSWSLLLFLWASVSSSLVVSVRPHTLWSHLLTYSSSLISRRSMTA